MSPPILTTTPTNTNSNRRDSFAETDPQPSLKPNVRDFDHHPAQIAVRTYAVCLSLSIGPSLISYIFSLLACPSSWNTRLSSLMHLLKRELGPTGFASAITFAVGGGAALERIWQDLADSACLIDSDTLRRCDISNQTLAKARLHLGILLKKLRLLPNRKAFFSNLVTSSVALIIMQRGRRERVTHPSRRIVSRPSPTFDLTLLFFVRSIDALFQASLSRWSKSRHPEPISSPKSPEHTILSKLVERVFPLSSQDGSKVPTVREETIKEWHRQVATRVDAIVFWACTARIMWCFFYQPHRLPPSYIKWITSLARVDKRLLDTLRALRAGHWSYIHSSSTSKTNLLTSLSRDLNLPEAWGDPRRLPAFGGVKANEIWKNLGVHGRNGTGGVPCELVHAGTAAKWGLGGNCAVNALSRAGCAFFEALAVYLPVHFLPVILTRPRSILHTPHALATCSAAIRSATFLAAFLSSYCFSICFTRTLVLARLFPWISHDIWDGPHGAVLIASLVCGGSIWIENARRRAEMALYVLLRALRACVPHEWIKGARGFQIVEKFIFVLSLTTLLTCARYQPNSLRGLSRWTLFFIMKGPTSLWKRRKTDNMVMNPPPVESVSIVPDSDLHPDQ
ncbi:hypothetical protein BJ138DRAFT_1007111 [Hygrophoropsis aurantiaca]|uniref:Uncharacterized protein n=1 Tax=Hygrophoropsis aurantiaca TaxID=72124 RepID=A0ACB8AES6_9AGAM|nr:hypothetical protein BJ138DRAFT_1007111 [Hygrophoropsis aurantiaca]